MPRNLDIALLRAFVTVAENGGMTRAATLLNLTQGAVSQQVKRLEALLDQAVFERDRAGMTLTAAGERLLPRAMKLVEMNDALWNQMIAPEVEGEVRLGVPHDIVAAFIPPILKTFAREWPRVRVTISADTSPVLKAQLDGGEVDLCLTTELDPPAPAEVLALEPLVWAGAPGGAAWRERPLPLVLGNETCAFRGSTLEVLARADVEWRLVSAMRDMESMYAVASADLAILALMGAALPPTLEVLPADCGLPVLPAFAIALYPPRRAAPPARVLADHIRRAFAARAVTAVPA